MATSTGNRLAQGIRQKMADLRSACAGVDEDTASRAPAGRWSPKEILSHLWGPEGAGHLPILQAFLDRENPTIDIEPEKPFYSERRAEMTFGQLTAEVGREYERLAAFAEGLGAEQMNRTARVPMLKNSPLGEYPTLEGMISGLGEFHLQFHIDHLREVLRELSQ